MVVPLNGPLLKKDYHHILKPDYKNNFFFFYVNIFKLLILSIKQYKHIKKRWKNKMVKYYIINTMDGIVLKGPTKNLKRVREVARKMEKEGQVSPSHPEIYSVPDNVKVKVVDDYLYLNKMGIDDLIKSKKIKEIKF